MAAGRRVAIVVAVTALTGATALAASGAGAQGAQQRRAAAAGVPVFGNPVVVDEFRPGFEPDLALDPRTGRQYVSWPNGFSTTQSFLERSDDNLSSFHLVPGNIVGKSATCVGGGDSELQVDRVNGAIYFADLQGLTNFSNSTSSDGGTTFTTSCTSVKGVGVDRQWLAIDDNGGASAVGTGASDGRLYFDYDNVAQNTDPATAVGAQGANSLVMNESCDGVYYGGSTALGGCPTGSSAGTLPPPVISIDEGLPGNVLVDNTRGGHFQHSVYAFHTNTAGDGVDVSVCRPPSADNTAALASNYCADGTAGSPTPGHMSTHWTDVIVRKADATHIDQAFTTGAIDTAGNLYLALSEYPTKTGAPSGTGSILYTRSTDGGQTWSPAVKVNDGTIPTVVQPWITAGDPGRVAIGFYAATEASDAGKYGPDTLNDGTWNAYVAASYDALTSTPTFAVVKASDHQVKFGNVSTAGLGGSPDRSLGDYMQVHPGPNGEIEMSSVDDTSANRNVDFTQGSGQSPAEAAGPVIITRQISGPSLYAHKTLSGTLAVGSVTDPVGVGFPDAYYGSAGSTTPATHALDIAGVSITQSDPGHLTITMKTDDPALAEDYTPPSSLGGTIGEWIVRWGAPSYHTIGDGHIYYVGMEAGTNTTPHFFTGTTASIDTTHAKYFLYPPTTTIAGRIAGSDIVWTVPTTLIDSPAKGQGLYSVTGFTATQPTPSQTGTQAPQGGTAGNPMIPNLIDAAPPFLFLTAFTSPVVFPPVVITPGPTGHQPGSGLATTGLAVEVPLIALLLVGVAAAVRRRSAARR